MLAQSSYSTYSTNTTEVDPTAFFAIFGVLLVIYLPVMILYIAGMWKTFTKAGEPGWAAIVPIYNIYVLLKIVGRPTWWLVLFLVPFINTVVAIIIAFDLAKSFGKSGGFGLGLAFLPPIFYPILGFGKAAYVGPAISGSGAYGSGGYATGYTSSGAGASVAAGWYPDPHGLAAQRWWDGANWTDYTA